MNSNNSPITLPYELEKTVLLIGKIILRNRKNILNQFGLTCTQFEILAAIFEHSNKGKELTQIRLSDTALIDAMTVSTVLRSLQKKGLVKRDRDDIDTRILKITFTTQGKLYFNQIIHEIDKHKISLYKDFEKSLLLTLHKKLEQSLHNCYFS